jgi:hypothetical protein
MAPPWPPNPGADRDGDPSHIVAVEFDLAGLEPAPHLDPEGS